MSKERRQPNAVVSGPRLFAECDNAIAVSCVVFDQLLAKAVADHTVADDDNGLL